MSSVVLVDDQGINRKVLSQLAASIEADVEIRAFGDPLQALGYVETHVPDLLVTDFQMPDINGAELIRRFRLLPHCREVPALMVTASQQVELRAMALAAGANDLLLSPLDHGEFLARSRKFLAMRRQIQNGVSAQSLTIGSQEFSPAGIKDSVSDHIGMFNGLLERVTESLLFKTREVAHLKAELRTILEVSSAQAVFVDEHLFIRHFTPQISRIYALVPHDVGRPLDAIFCNLAYNDLARDFLQAMQTGKTVERYLEQRFGDVFYKLRIIPNRSRGKSAAGATLIFTNATSQYRSSAVRRQVH